MFRFSIKILFILFFSLWCGLALADTAGSFRVWPAKTELWLSPSETKSFDLQIENHLGTGSNFFIKVEDFRWAKENKVDFLADLNYPNSLRPFLSQDVTKIFIPAGGKTKIPVNISVPSSAGPGGYWSAVIVEPENREGTNKGATIRSRIASLIFLRIKGEATERGVVVNWGQTSRSFPDSRIETFISYRNEGNVYLTPYGLIQLKNWRGRIVKEWSIEPWFVLPQSERTKEQVIDPGNLFGWYKLELKLNLGYGDQIETKSFWLWRGSQAWVLSLIGLGLIVFVFLLTHFVIKLKHRRK